MFLYLDLDVAGTTTAKLDTIIVTPTLQPGQIRFVLSWPDKPKDLDLHSFFAVSMFSICEVYFGKRQCAGVVLDTDNYDYGTNGAETITINTLGNYVYSIAINNYIDVSDGIAAGDDPINSYPSNYSSNTSNSTSSTGLVPLMLSKAMITVYVPEYKAPIVSLPVPSKFQNDNTAINDPNKFTWWLAMCLNGRQGIDSLIVVNNIYMNKPRVNVCEAIYR